MAKISLGGLTISTKAALPLCDVQIWADATHPNKLKFKGILVPLDEPSDKPPEGAQGHRIVLPSEVAERQLDTLIGMGVNYHDSLKSHAPDRKVGVIEKAWIKGKALWISGYVWAQDFPEAEKVLHMPNMGMSMELTGVRVQDSDAEVWVLTDFIFTGGTFLWQHSAAYRKTSAIAAAADSRIYLNTEAVMPKNNQTRTTRSIKPNHGAAAITDEQKLVAKLAASAAGVSISKQLGPVLLELSNTVKANAKVTQSLLDRINASEDDEDEDEADDDSDVHAAAGDKGGKGGQAEDDEDTDDSDWDDDDSEDDDDVDGNALTDVAGNDDGAGKSDNSAGEDNDVGHINEKDGGKSRGNTSELEASLAAAKSGKNKWKTRALASAATNKTLTAENARLRSKVSASADRLKANAGAEVRKSLSPTTVRLMAKGGLDVEEIRASGTALDNASVDAIFRQFPNISIEDRAGMKLELVNAGIMRGPGQK